MPSAETGWWRAVHHANRRLRSVVCSRRSRRPPQGACSTGVTRASAVASIPGDYLVLYQRWGSAYGVPWQLLAAVGSVESRHGRDPGAFVPHTRGVLGPMQFQAASNAQALRTNDAGDQGFGGTWGEWRRSSGHPPYRMDDPDDEIAAAAAKIASDAGAGRVWTRALWRYNALHSYRKAVLRRAARLGMNSACGLLGRPAAPTVPAQPAVAATPKTVPATPKGLLSNDALAFAPAAAGRHRRGIADRSASSRSWPGSLQRHRIVVERHPHRAPPLRDGHRTRSRTTGMDAQRRSARSMARPWRWIARRGRALGSAAVSLRVAAADEIGIALVDPANPRWFTGPDEQAEIAHRLRRRRREALAADHVDADSALHALRGVPLDGAVEVVGAGLREGDREARCSCRRRWRLSSWTPTSSTLPAVEQQVVRACPCSLARTCTSCRARASSARR